MTSYDHPDDAARYQSRRHDSFREQPQDYLNPNTSYDPSKRPREHRRSVSRRREDDRRYHENRPRSRHSATHSSDDQRSRQSRRPAPTWPPAPHVESEARSLAREAGGVARLRKLSKDDVPSRGVIDQDPLIEDVAEYANQAERGFVLLSKTEGGSRSMHTPPSSEDERKKTQRRPSRLMTDFSTLPPEMQSRVSSPYANSSSAARPSGVPSNTFLSPDVLTPPASDVSLRQKSTGIDPQLGRYSRTSPTARRQRDYFSSESIENAIDDSDSHSRPSSRGSQARAGAQQTGYGVSSQDFAKPPAPLDRDSRRQTFAADGRPRVADKTVRASPLAAAAAAGALGEAVRSARENGTSRSATLNPGFLRESSGGSRNVSPAASIHSQRSASPPAPGRLARHSTDYSQDYNVSSPNSRRESVISSRTGSRPGTPPFGNIAMPRMPQNDDDWSAVLATNAARRPAGQSKPPSRLSAAMRADSLPNVPRSMSQRPGASLPYPIHEGPATPSVAMPQETEHQWFPTAASDINSDSNKPGVKPSQQSERSSRLPRHSFTFPEDAKSARPVLPSHPSIPDARPVRMDTGSMSKRPQPAKPTRPELVSQPSATEVRPTRQEADAMLKRGLPGCSRSLPVAGYDDWYTLIGAPSLDFCPKCIDLFERTVYRKCFRRSLPRELSTKIRCAFGTPWFRLAYLLSVQERLPNLKLMKDLADIDKECDPCPGHQFAVRTWHGLRDDQGLFVRSFNICQADILKLQHLLPTFKGFFQPLPDNAMYEKRRCALRPETHRFSQYLNAIIGLHDEANAKDTIPNRMPFVALVEKKLSYRECERDVLLVDGLWHYMPALPAFTVCEDCFEEVVEPEIAKGSDIAKRFNRTVQPNHGEGTIGTSCQLYSPRMRKVFKSAVEDGDMKYLARKAKGRREAEIWLQERNASLLRKAQKIVPEGWPGSGGAEEQREKRRIDRELAQITTEWRENWE